MMMNTSSNGPAPSRTVMLVEDEPDIASILVDYLESSGFKVSHFSNGKTAHDALERSLPSLILLDVMLPGMNGIDLLRSVRSRSLVPVIMLTARVEEMDRLNGLELGADDYMCKPFSPREVVARVKAVLRRTEVMTTPVPERKLRLDAERGEVLVYGRHLEITRKEFLLLNALASRPGKIFARAQLLEYVYPGEYDVSERALDSHVKNIRKKFLQFDPTHDWIRSVYGIGFCLEEP
jgi:two-component system response regulator BaeR